MINTDSKEKLGEDKSVQTKRQSPHKRTSQWKTDNEHIKKSNSVKIRNEIQNKSGIFLLSD